MLLRLLMIELHNASSNLSIAEPCNRKAKASGIQILCQIHKEFLARMLDEDVDPAGAAEPASCIETDQRWFTSFENFACAQLHFFFETSRTERTDRFAVRPNQHSCARPPIARALYTHQSRECV